MAAVPFLPSTTAHRAARRIHGPTAVRAGRSRLGWLTAVPVVAGVVALSFNRVVLAGAVERVASLRPADLALVLVVLLAQKAATATVHHGATEGVGWSRAALAAEAYLGASNSMVGGSGIGTGVRVAMLRSWGVDAIDAASAVVLTAVVPAVVMWAIALVHTAPDVLVGRADALSTIVAVAGLLAVLVPLLVGRRILRDVHALARPAALLHRVRDDILRRLPAHGPLARLGRRIRTTTFAHVDLTDAAERLHVRAAEVVRRRIGRVVLASVAAQLLTGALLLVCVQVLAPGSATVGVWSLLRAYALLRVAASFIPVPGGIGVLDLGLLGVLSHAGVDRATAVAALGLFRGLTFALPLVSGPLATVWWQATRRRDEARALRRS